MALLKEGHANLVCIKDTIFFSPIQRLQRDLGIQTIGVFLDHYFEINPERKGKELIHILDAFSGCGIRGIRYALEVEGVGKVTCNDINLDSVATINENWKASCNGTTECEFEVVSKDTNLLLASSPECFHVIDLDPCGSPAPYLRSAVSALKNGGLLCVACTDYKDLFGLNGEAGAQRSFSRYGGWVGTGASADQTSAFMAETAMRVIVNMISCVGGSIGRRIECCLCASFSFFVRICVRVYDDIDQNIGHPSPILVSRHIRHHSNKTFQTGDFKLVQLGAKNTFMLPNNVLGPMFSKVQLCDLKLLEGMITKLQLIGQQTIQSLMGTEPTTWQVVAFEVRRVFSDLEMTTTLFHESLRTLFLSYIQSSANDSFSYNSLNRLLRLLQAEHGVSSLFSYCMREMTQTSSVIVHRDPIMTSLVAKGYIAVPSHIDASSLKTDAPFTEVEQVIDQYIQACRGGSSEAQGGGHVIEQCRKMCSNENKKSRLIGNMESVVNEMFDKMLKLTVVPTTAVVPVTTSSSVDGVCGSCYHDARRHLSKFPDTGRMVLVSKDKRSGEFVCQDSLADACLQAQEGDVILLTSSERGGGCHVPAEGICLKTAGVWIKGCSHGGGDAEGVGVSVKITQHSQPKGKHSKSTAMFTVAAKGVVLSDVDIEMCGGGSNEPNRQTCCVMVEGEGNSLMMIQSTIHFIQSVNHTFAKQATSFVPGKKNNMRSHEHVKPVGIAVASCAMLSCHKVSVLGAKHLSRGGVLLSGRAGALLESCHILEVDECGVLVQSGGIAILRGCVISQALTGVAVSGMGSDMSLSQCSINCCARLYAEASRQARLQVYSCKLGQDDGGSGGGGVLVKHASTTAEIHSCVIKKTRLAMIDVRDDAYLGLSHSLLSHGRTSGVYASARGTIALGQGFCFLRCGLAAVEVAYGAQVICQSLGVANALIEPNCSEIEYETEDSISQFLSDAGLIIDCGVPLLVSHSGAFGVLS